MIRRLLWSPWVHRRAASVRRIPIAGGLLGHVTRRILPRHVRVWTRIRGGPGRGLLMALPPRVGLDLASGDCEPAVQAVLLELLRPGSSFVDAGANLGFFTLLAARLSGPDGRVLAFEPDPEVRSWLEANVSRNGFTGRVRTESLAIWRQSGHHAFERADPSISPDRGIGRLAGSNRQSRAAPSSLCVSTTSLDDYFASGSGSRLQPPDVIKLDLEGAECGALQGAEQLLAGRTSVWIVEVHDPPGAGEVVSRFKAAGYSLRVLEDSQETPLNPGHGSHLLAVPLRGSASRKLTARLSDRSP
jgi:FkbM family methyltransferase